MLHTAGDVETMARTVLAQAGVRVHEQRSVAGDVMLARLRQLARQVDSRSSLGLQIRTRLAAEDDYRSGRHEAVLRMVAEATRLGDPVARASALSLAQHCLLGPGGPERAALRRELAGELVSESLRTQRRGDMLLGLLWQVVDHFVAGDPQAGRRLGELQAALADGDHQGIAYLASTIDVMVAIRAGDLDRAEAQAWDCLQRGSAIDDLDATWHFMAHVAAIRWYQGRFAQLQPLLAEAVNSPTLRVVDYQYGALAHAAAANGDRWTAESTLAALRGRHLRDLPRSPTWLATMYCVAETAYLLGEAEPAEEVYELLGPYADLPAMSGLGIMCLGSVRHVLGVAAMTAGRLEASVAHFRAAVRDNLALQHRPAVLMSRVRYAQALVRRGGPDDLALARDVMTIAAQEADRLRLPLPAFGDERPDERPEATCTRNGQQWQIRYGGRRLLLPYTVGISYLAVLLGNPGRDIAAVDLAAGLEAVRANGVPAQPLLDAAAVRHYRMRVAELDGRVDDLASPDQHDDAVAAGAERDWLLGELASATGLARRSRTFTTDHERARLAVSKAIYRTRRAIERADPAIGDHLRRTIRTGTLCSYRPH
jgi:hypothetical protein